jgi:hypothetical protein
MSENVDFSFDVSRQRLAVLSGVFRLESTGAYDRLFESVRQAMATSTEAYTIDIASVVFMNSSGIRALAMLVLGAKKSNVPVRLLCSPESAWQKKTLDSLRILNPGLAVEAAPRTNGA